MHKIWFIDWLKSQTVRKISDNQMVNCLHPSVLPSVYYTEQLRTMMSSSSVGGPTNTVRESPQTSVNVRERPQALVKLKLFS